MNSESEKLKIVVKTLRKEGVISNRTFKSLRGSLSSDVGRADVMNFVRNNGFMNALPTPDVPYLLVAKVVHTQHYNPYYGDDRICICGHTYYRHFDTYEDMEACGCKYCECYKFHEDEDKY
jgi:hypothetical protein